jgi:radical SAM protein with 4Fe4S-binding SPASM domain
MLENKYLELKKVTMLPRLPLKGQIDLTYRCDNNCRHCWVRIPQDSREKKNELTFEQIKGIAEEARSMGCRGWHISGGEPMLRLDFTEIFDYLTNNSNSYSINTNGTLITPKIAKIMKRKGVKMVALYGATKDVHDHITRNPGSFEATIQGFRYLKEAGAGFTVQLIPMKDSYHQFQDMVKLAESLSRHWRIGAAWLYLSAYGDEEKNAEIKRQRLSPEEVVEIDKPDLSYEREAEPKGPACQGQEGARLLRSCINSRREFHIDPYGTMSFCHYIKEPGLRYDLRMGNFKECWEEFIPGLQDRIRLTKEYKENCGSCDLRGYCRCCPVYSYLEHRRFTAKVGYLCEVARTTRKDEGERKKVHRRFYGIGGLTIQVDSDLPISDETFHPKFKLFETGKPGEDNISIRHHFSLPDLEARDLGKEVYRKPPWAIYKKGDSWIYLGISPVQGDKHLHRVAVFSDDHTRAKIYNPEAKWFLKGSLHSLTLLPTDQILLARILADREGCLLHGCGVNLNGKGLLFVGHSSAGKSTMAAMLKGKAEILCDDRMIIRRQPLTANRSPLTANREPHSGFRIYGTWSHGDVPDVSANPAPLNAILFLEKAGENQLIPINDKKETAKRLLDCLIRPLVTIEWWEKELRLIEKIVEEVPCYTLRFEISGRIAGVLEDYTRVNL